MRGEACREIRDDLYGDQPIERIWIMFISQQQKPWSITLVNWKLRINTTNLTAYYDNTKQYNEKAKAWLSQFGGGTPNHSNKESLKI